MASIILECPHCGADKMGFQISTQWGVINPPPGIRKFRAVMICPGCGEIVIGKFAKPHAAPGFADLGQCPGDPTMYGFAFEGMYPAPAPSRCPEHTPDALKRVFLQAVNGLKRGDPDASGAMSRKVVDNSTQLLLAEEAKNYSNIYGRIEALKTKGMLTPDLASWAHEVRLGGADAAHDLDPFTQEEADELLDFAELFLIYVYSLPERLKLRRAKAAEEKAKKSGG